MFPCFVVLTAFMVVSCSSCFGSCRDCNLRVCAFDCYCSIHRLDGESGFYEFYILLNS